MNTLLNQTSTYIILLILLGCMWLALFLGRRFGIYISEKYGDIPDNSQSLISAVLGLAALVLAFSFSMSGSRHEQRRQAIINEANAIGTATLRASLYPDSVRLALMKDFNTYLEQRIAFFEVGARYDSAFYWEGEAEKTGKKLWEQATNYAKATNTVMPSGQMIPALNSMFDLAAERHYALISKVPEPILYLLFFLSIVSAFFAGYSGKKQRVNKLVSFLFCVLSAAIVFTTLDLDRPRRGLIQYNETHQIMLDQRKLFNP
jgi:cytochrome bd-type quinol oxidase subunit 2